jgi:predicted 2-oxoglutarate/Fe(II)-dependent dioxygenase YbiX
MRNIQHYDFLPDFFLINQVKTIHSASMAGKKWVLFVSNKTDVIKNFQLQILTQMKLYESLKDISIFATFELTDNLVSGNIYHIKDSELAQFFLEEPLSSNVISSFVIDVNLKIISKQVFATNDFEANIHLILSSLAQDFGEDPLLIPVLRVPSVFDKEFCQFLVKHFQDNEEQIQGRIGSNPELKEKFKKSVHVNVNPSLANEIDNKLILSLIPAIERVFDKRISHRVAYKIACYDSSDNSFFTSHRDNQDPGMTFRRIGMSISLNDDWDGGGICFPEFSKKPFKLPVGDALIWPASLLHQVSPITKGKRFVLISFLYDLEGAELRRSTIENTDVLNGKYKDSIEQSLIEMYNKFAPVSRFSPTYDAYLE